MASEGQTTLVYDLKYTAWSTTIENNTIAAAIREPVAARSGNKPNFPPANDDIAAVAAELPAQHRSGNSPQPTYRAQQSFT